MQEISGNYLLWFNDIFWAPVALILLSIFVYRKRLRYNDSEIQRYYFPAFYLRIFSAVIFTLLGDYYFGFADTNHYFQAVLDMDKAVSVDVNHLTDIYFNLKLTPDNPVYPYFVYDPLGITHLYMIDVTNYITPKFALPFSLLFGKSYLAISFCLSFWSFGGAWRLFKVFYAIYPHLHKKIAIACLFMPSILFWSTSLLKDTVCLGAIGYFVYAAFNIFIQHKRRLIDLLFLLGCAFLLFYIKAYILLTLLVAFPLWIFLRARVLIKDKLTRQISTFFFIMIAFVGSLFLVGQFASSEYTEKFTSDKIIKSAQDQQQLFVRNQVATGSNFKLNNIGDSPVGFFFAFLTGIVNTFFRPFPWDIRSAFMLLSFLESFGFLILTFMIFRKISFLTFLRYVTSSPVVSFSLLFALIFGGFVGMSTGNFGALSRYKIPALSFYAMALFIIMDMSGKFSSKYIFNKRFF